MGRLRSKKEEAEYEKAKEAGILDNSCVLCKMLPIKTYKHWKILKNDFPYDRIAVKHDMIVSLRHAQYPELTKDELDEFEKIKEEYIQPNYEWILEATRKRQSIPAHFHLHMIIAKE